MTHASNPSASFEGKPCRVCMEDNLPYCTCDHPPVGVNLVTEWKCGLCGSEKGQPHGTVACTMTHVRGEDG